jgi:hypothetical protein
MVVRDEMGGRRDRAKHLDMNELSGCEIERAARHIRSAMSEAPAMTFVKFRRRPRPFRSRADARGEVHRVSR